MNSALRVNRRGQKQGSLWIRGLGHEATLLRAPVIEEKNCIQITCRAFHLICKVQIRYGTHEKWDSEQENCFVKAEYRQFTGRRKHARTEGKASPWENTGLLLLRNPGRSHRKNLNRLLFILLMGEFGTQENKRSEVAPSTQKRGGLVTFDISDSLGQPRPFGPDLLTFQGPEARPCLGQGCKLPSRCG